MKSAVTPWSDFSSREWSLESQLEELGAKAYSVKYLGTEEVDGYPCDVVGFHLADKASDINWDGKCFVGIKDHFVHRLVKHSIIGDRGGTYDAVIKNIDLQPKTSKGTYVYSPPPGITRMQPPSGSL